MHKLQLRFTANSFTGFYEKKADCSSYYGTVSAKRWWRQSSNHRKVDTSPESQGSDTPQKWSGRKTAFMFRPFTVTQLFCFFFRLSTDLSLIMKRHRLTEASNRLFLSTPSYLDLSKSLLHRNKPRSTKSIVDAELQQKLASTESSRGSLCHTVCPLKLLTDEEWW